MKSHIRYAAAFNRTAGIVLALWLAFGGVAATAAASASCNGACCRLQDNSEMLRSPVRHCCSGANQTPCNLTEPEGPATLPGILAASPTDGGIVPPPASAFKAAADESPPRSLENFPASFHRTRPPLLLYLQHNALLC